MTSIRRVSDTIVVFPPPNYALPSTPTTEKNIQQAVQGLERILREMETNNPAYHELVQYVGLQQLSYITESEAGTQRLEAMGVTIPPTLRVETEPATSVRDIWSNMPTHPESTPISD